MSQETIYADWSQPEDHMDKPAALGKGEPLVRQLRSTTAIWQHCMKDSVRELRMTLPRMRRRLDNISLVI